MLNKLIDITTIKTLSEKGAEEFYVQGIPLPGYQSTCQADSASGGVGGGESNPEDIGKTRQVNSRVSTSDFAPLKDRSLRRVLVELTSRRIPVALQSEIYGILSTSSGAKLSRIQKQAVTSGLIRLHRIQKGKGSVVLWEATQKAYTWLDLPYPIHHSLGGMLHARVVDEVKSLLQQRGWYAATEYALSNGYLVDLTAKKEDRLYCFEVGLPPLSKEVHNSAKIWDSGLNPTRVVHLVADASARRKLQDLLSGEPDLAPYLDRTAIRLAGDFFTVCRGSVVGKKVIENHGQSTDLFEECLV
jgi:hypothetical protein